MRLTIACARSDTVSGKAPRSPRCRRPIRCFSQGGLWTNGGARPRAGRPTGPGRGAWGAGCAGWGAGQRRMSDWYGQVAGETVVVAHGGTARALMVALGFETAQSAADLPIAQGAVYVFGEGGLKKYS